jgi:hypothetical protein
MGPYSVSYVVYNTELKKYSNGWLSKALTGFTEVSPLSARRFDDEKSALDSAHKLVEIGGYIETEIKIKKIYFSWEEVDVTESLIDAKLPR